MTVPRHKRFDFCSCIKPLLKNKISSSSFRYCDSFSTISIAGVEAMETSGIVFRSTPFFSGVGFDTHSSKSFFSSSLSFDAGNQFPGELKLSGSHDCHRFSTIRPRVFSGISNSGFSDEGHLRCYVSPPVCGTKKIKEQKKKKEDEKKKNPEMAKIKKNLKLIKGLSKDLSTFSSMGFGLETGAGLIGQIREKKLSEAAEILLAQLQLLRAEEKEMKRKRKEEKASLKAMQMINEMDCESSSSNNECGEVVDMRIDSLPACSIDQVQVKGTLTSMSSSIKEDKKTVQVEGIENHGLDNFRQGCCNVNSCSNGSSSSSSSSSSGAIVVRPSSHRIEVCMGGKCRKSGAAELLEEFERKVGVGGTVVGCKCMGKCKDGPNVRVLNHCNNDDHHQERVEEGVVGQRHPTNPLCIGVGLEDVGVNVANLFGEERKGLGPTVAAA